jgi:hypothetical protein
MAPWDIAAILAAFAAIGWFVKVMLSGDDERHEEEAARAFFDEHNHWPDEDPAAATDPSARRD